MNAKTTTITKQRKSTSHVFHLLMTCITFGLWIPIWAAMSAYHQVGPRSKSISRSDAPAPVAAAYAAPTDVPGVAEVEPVAKSNSQLWAEASTFKRFAVVFFFVSLVLFIWAANL